MLELHGHLFSSYTWKALIPLYANDTPFTFIATTGDRPLGEQKLLVEQGHERLPRVCERFGVARPAHSCKERRSAGMHWHPVR